MPTRKRILIPIDGSYYCQKAFQWVLDHIHKPNDIIILVHVVQPPILKSFTFKSGIKIPVEDISKKFKEKLQKAEKLHSTYSNDCVDANIKHEYYTITSKCKGEAICQSSLDNNADMIVIGSRSTRKRKNSSSVSNFLISRSTVPVTIVPDFDEQEANYNYSQLL